MSKYKEIMDKYQAYQAVGKEFAPPSKHDIRQIELEVGCPLPEDYRDFLFYYGGYSTHNNTFAFCRSNGEIDDSCVDYFYGIFPGNTNDMLVNYRVYKGRMPHNIIAIAPDPGAGEVCISLYGKDRDSIYYWDRYLEEDIVDGREPGYSNLFLLAPSFDIFINNLKEYPYP